MPMNTYPASTDYFKAVQYPARAFTLDSLREATFVTDSLGLPTLATGTSAVVFHAVVRAEPKALRCFIRDEASTKDRYGALGDYLSSHDLRPYVSPTTWFDAAIQVSGATWPVLQMEWIEGRTLDQHIDVLIEGSDTGALATLADRWRELITILQRAEFAHGDLQHGNVLVDPEGRLRLVDFDGVWIPALASKAAPTESGHQNYQHPRYNGGSAWGRWLDRFSALVIYLSLVALAKNPGLWRPLYNSKNLLFQQADFLSPFRTPIWTQLGALRDPEVDHLARQLMECCDPAWDATTSLEKTIEVPWWRKQGVRQPDLGETGQAPATGTAAGASSTVPRVSPGRQAGPHARPAQWWAEPARPPGQVPPAQVASRSRAVGILALCLGLVALLAGIKLPALIVVGLASGAWGAWTLIRAARKSPRPPP